MAERVSFLFGAPRRVKISAIATPADIDVVEFDATLTEDHSMSARLTDHPVETGTQITDHYRLMPKSITVNGIVSNNNLPGLLPVPGAAAVAGIISSIDSRITQGRANAAYDKIEKSMKKGELLNVLTTLKEYKNMLITSVSVRRDSNNGNVLNSVITLREVKLAIVKTLGETSSPTDPKDSPVENKGVINKSPATANQSSSAAVGKSAISNPF